MTSSIQETVNGALQSNGLGSYMMTMPLVVRSISRGKRLLAPMWPIGPYGLHSSGVSGVVSRFDSAAPQAVNSSAGHGVLR